MNCYLCGQNATLINEKHSPLSTRVECVHCGTYYMEPVFRSMLETLNEYFPPTTNQLVLDSMKTIVKTHPLVIFTGNVNYPLTHVDEGIFLEMADILDPLHLTIQNNSEKGDYGD